MMGDLRALGYSAPLRAAYEASKRSNFHRLLFREIDPASVPTSVVLSLGDQVPEGVAARTRCLDDARQVVNQGTRVFGRRVPTGARAEWGTDPLTGEVWPETTPWWQIDIRSEARLSDVKYVWEAGRHRDLVVLARASVLDPVGPWFDHMVLMVERWVRECRPERGIHWYSSLELALRAVAWAQVIALVGDRLHPDLRARMDHQLMASARHILVELPYTFSSMKNNHLLGDGLGLVVLGLMFPERGKNWRKIGDRLMLMQLRRHMRPDGFMIEDSLSYHRFVLEMLIVRYLLGGAPDELRCAMEAAGIGLLRLGVLDGPVPQFGDWDEGRILVDSGPAGSTAGSAWASLALSGFDVPLSTADEYDELAWYLGPERGHRPLPSLDEGCVQAGYFVRLDAGARRLWFKIGGGPSHQHADLSSVWIRDGERWLLEDPGTGTYNGPLHIRNGFRTSAAHTVRVPLGGDQLLPHRAFRWLRSVRSAASSAGRVDDCVAVLSVHNAFQTEHGRVARVVLAGPGGVTVVDAVEEARGGWTMTLPLGPDASVEEFFGLTDLVCHRGEESPWLGWRSPTYGRWERSTWAQVSGPSEHQGRWGVGEISNVQVDFRWGDSSVQARLSGSGSPLMLTAVGV
ncbi:heparinase II/III domain-containing protein [Nocardioides marmoribigeumensis]|uniref:Heparin-sulfate lyase N-terminal domain-containing protein n=1 Tax=Nocardioides marmoribigeumensis TaxID=433649 RepID=A0ABU2BUR2_9ACTN|nr:heparinase II/III family protein [Nocardioides marmoribigeumensis]MDR7361991.1 hypothetical protein [Nocardioides marmoribigeumensis]